MPLQPGPSPTSDPVTDETRICPVCRTVYEGTERLAFCPREGSYLVTQEELQNSAGDRLLGRRIGEFAIAARIGGGGMGTVYRAIQVGVDRTVALKILHPDLMGNAELVQRFFQEAKATARLQHRHLATIYTSGSTADGLLYLAMEYVPGGSLRQLIDGAWDRETYTLAPERAVRLFCQVVSALAHAHRNGIVHRDLKPDNVLLSHDEEDGEQVKLVDFGIAKILGLSQADQIKTQNGLPMGTALYMAPEQWSSSQADPRVDVYALGLLFHELLGGLLPFEQVGQDRDVPLVMLNKRMTQPAPPPVASEGRPLSPELLSLCADLLDIEPLRRPAHAGEVRERLKEVPEAIRGGWVAAPSGLFPVSQLMSQIQAYDPAATLVNQPLAAPQGQSPRRQPDEPPRQVLQVSGPPSTRSPTQPTLVDEPLPKRNATAGVITLPVGATVIAAAAAASTEPLPLPPAVPSHAAQTVRGPLAPLHGEPQRAQKRPLKVTVVIYMACVLLLLFSILLLMKLMPH